MKTTMKILALSTLLAAGTVLAHGAPVAATVNAVDAKAGTVTLQMADGATGTFKAEGKAASHLAKLTTGEKVAVTFRDQPAGMHAAITSIKAEAPAAKK
jgi:hypothetical protein